MDPVEVEPSLMVMAVQGAVVIVLRAAHRGPCRGGVRSGPLLGRHRLTADEPVK
jgi:hypothetical protein